MSSQGQVVLVTGASSGLGAATAAALAARGHRVYGTSRRAPADPTSVRPGAPFALAMDVGDEVSVARGVATVLGREGRLDAVVNNAGVGLAGAVEDTSVDEARALFETNFFGVHRVCRHVLPVLRERGAGVVVNIGSIAGLVAIPFQGFYSASKYALEGLSDALRREVAPFGVRVALVEPGDFRTGFPDHRVFADGAGADSAYRARCERAVAKMEADERSGADPEAVARRVVAIVEGRASGARHLVGPFAQRAAGRLAPVLPSRWLDRLLTSLYG